MPCLKGTLNCTVTTPTDRYGVLSGYPSTAGYDLASGLGSVNAANLVNSWANANFVASSATLTLSQSTITHGSPISATVKVSSTTGTPTGNVSINALATNGSVQSGTLQNGSYTASLSDFPGGAYSVQAHYAGDGDYAPSDSNPVTLTVSPESSTTTLESMLYNPSAGTTATSPAALPTPMAASSSSAPMLPASPGREAPPATSRLPIQAFRSMVAPSDSTQPRTQRRRPRPRPRYSPHHRHLLGRRHLNPSTSAPYIINITRAQTATALQVSAPVLSAASTLTFTALINARGYGAGQLQGPGAAAPSGTVTFGSGNAVLGTAVITPKSIPRSPETAVGPHLPFPPVDCRSPPTQSQSPTPATPTTHPPPRHLLTVTVTGSTQAASSTVLTLSASTVPAGAPYTFTATVVPKVPNPPAMSPSSVTVSRPAPHGHSILERSPYPTSISPSAPALTSSPPSTPATPTIRPLSRPPRPSPSASRRSPAPQPSPSRPPPPFRGLRSPSPPPSHRPLRSPQAPHS